MKIYFDVIRQNRIRILLYHNICLSEDDPFSVSPQSFAAQMDCLAQSHLPVLSLEQALAFLKQSRSLQRGVVITFDDAYQDLLKHAFPVLSEYKFPATIFTVTNKAGKCSDWGHASPSYPTLTWPELAQLSAMGFKIGSHTCTHPRLPALSPDELAFELQNSRQAIAEKIGEKFIALSYPFGSFSERVKTAARQAGYACGLTGGSLWGNGAETDPFALNRELIVYTTRLKEFQQAINGRNDLTLLWRDLTRASITIKT